MGYENYERKSKAVVLLVVIILIVLGLLAYMYYQKYLKGDSGNYDLPDVTQKEEVIDYDELTDDPLNSDEEYDLTLSNGKFMENVTDAEYNKWLTINKAKYDKTVKEYEKVFTYGAYDIYKNKDYNKDSTTEDEYNSEYLAVNTKNKIVLATMPFGQENVRSNNLYIIIGPQHTIGMINIDNKLVLVGYDNFSCNFHSDESYTICADEKTTMISKLNDKEDGYKRGIISINSFRTIIPAEYDEINDINKTDYFLVSKNKFNGIMNNKGKTLLDLEYDYIGYNEYLGFITINNKRIKLLNEDLEEVDKDIKTAFTEAVTRYNTEAEKNQLEKDKLSMSDAYSYYWTVGAEMQYTDISKDIDVQDDSYRYKYSGNTFTGKQLIINSTCRGDNSFIYVINNDKVDKISKNEIKFPVGEEGAQEGLFCF